MTGRVAFVRDPERALKKKVAWWEWADAKDRREAFLRGRYLLKRCGAEAWVKILFDTFRHVDLKSARTREIVRRVFARLLEDPVGDVTDDLRIDLRKSLESVARLGDDAATRAWCRGLVEHKIPLTPDQKLALRLDGKARAAEERERHARAKLAEAERALARAKRQVKKWKTKVQYYDRKEKRP